ncbi:MAG TPA: hypothetical protein VFS40_06195 [Gemmatimonadales bacterium]|nr:hypothetical protein [Gemmatimonadales bacterium]
MRPVILRSLLRPLLRPLLRRPLRFAPALALLTAATPAPPSPHATTPAPAAPTAWFGPPWIAIEYPANPIDRTTRGAVLLVHTFHHEQAIATRLEGVAERVDPERRAAAGSAAGVSRVALRFESTSRPGVYALRRTWPAEGRWLLTITMGGGEAAATAVVGVAEGEVRLVRVPAEVRDGWTIPRAPTAAELDAARRALSEARSGA